MTSRQARTARREAERKARKAEYKRQKAAAREATELTLEQEFSPELIAEANAARERIHRAAGIAPIPAPSSAANPGFVSQRTPEPPPSAPTPRTLANRANAQHSTGPRSITGKLASSRNSLQHGLASGQVIIPGEDPAQFEALLNDLLADHQPATTTEELLVHQMAQSYWLTQRALRLQNECFTAEGVDEKRLALFLRYQTTHDRAFHKALNTLLKLQKERLRGFVSQSSASNRGFVSQDAQEPQDFGTPTGGALGAEGLSDQFVWQNQGSEAA